MAGSFGRIQVLLREGAAPMTSAPVRDPLADHLLTPQNAAFLLIDFQPQQLGGVRSMDRDLMVKNAVSTVRTIKTVGLPVVHSTVNVASGREQPTLPELADLLTDVKPLDRTTINSWEDIEFVQAVHATGRRKLIFCALWTEMCMAFAALDALREGYEVYPVVDAIGGTSPEAHRAGLDRVMQADGRLDPEVLSGLPDDELMAQLTVISGIGPWTVQGAMLIALGREDVVLPGDLALRKAVQAAYQLDHIPTQQEVLDIADKWRPYRSLATSYLFSAAFEPAEASPTAQHESTGT
jgi:nicotinamidase-related amidase